MRDLYQYCGVAETVDFDHLKEHYYGSYESTNPTRVLPKDPIIDFPTPHDREGLVGCTPVGAILLFYG